MNQGNQPTASFTGLNMIQPCLFKICIYGSYMNFLEVGLNVVVQWLTFLFHVQDVLSFSFGLEIVYHN
jgi:hypothetical protein